jgi:hypothetical protein
MSTDQQSSAGPRGDCRPRPPLWRQTFDAIERPIAAASESWVQSDVFMDALSVSWRLQRRLLREAQRCAGVWLELWGVPRRADVLRLVNQVAGLERQLRDLRRELEQRDEAATGTRPATRRARSAARHGR